jgi:hypothetical protein
MRCAPGASMGARRRAAENTVVPLIKQREPDYLGSY